ncbi:unnamed protein product [Bemisia tabaci]|uniref:DIRP domain-containing protein n=1 Tax=Bemisia tabaci TaxID=7038 RepID=A0A9P0AHK6_BEMTA|nr:PREDICTED: protein lin-9 homolog [Bemisia tabaci]CAH0391753.1 unnamed protein product [Bemisia tabaci]
MNLKKTVKTEPQDEEMELGPAIFGLKRVGTEDETAHKEDESSTPSASPALNNRGMPARIRKKNKLFYDEDMFNASTVGVKRQSRNSIKASPKKPATPAKAKQTPTSTPKSTPRIVPKSTPKSARSPPEMVKETSNLEGKGESASRKTGHKIGMKLRNLLKLPKAHKWVCHEWFYSNLDVPLFLGDNDFLICIRESFPELKTTKLSRPQWRMMRRMMGKPRRCSQTFFDEERREIERRRNNIRSLQQRKACDISCFKGLPPEIPLQLVLGTKVTARLRKPQDGLFTGIIDALDTSNNTYRITFERGGLGTHSIPDYEVLSNDPPDTISISSYLHKIRPPQSNSAMSVDSDSLSSRDVESGGKLNQLISPGGTMGGYRVEHLESMVRLNKLLAVKKLRIQHLKEMNSDAERRNLYGRPLSHEFKIHYASCVIELEQLNTALKDTLTVLQSFVLNNPEKEQQMQQIESCPQVAAEIVEKNNSDAKNKVNDESMINLIVDLTSLLLQVKILINSDESSVESKIVKNSISDVKQRLDPVNQMVFENNVEVHLRHIQAGVSNHVNSPFIFPFQS